MGVERRRHGEGRGRLQPYICYAPRPPSALTLLVVYIRGRFAEYEPRPLPLGSRVGCRQASVSTSFEDGLKRVPCLSPASPRWGGSIVHASLLDALSAVVTMASTPPARSREAF